MLKILAEIEKELFELLNKKAAEGQVKTMYIDYHKPFVKRIWFQHGEYRVYLHKIEACDSPEEALYHPHPWESAVKIVSGDYIMGVGHSETDEAPVTDCRLILKEGTKYEMNEPHAWHYVSPQHEGCYSLMVTGKRIDRKMPLEPKKQFRILNGPEIMEILEKFAKKSGSAYYQQPNYLKYIKDLILESTVQTTANSEEEKEEQTNEFKPVFYWSGNIYTDAMRINSPHIKAEGEQEDRIAETLGIMQQLANHTEFTLDDAFNIQNHLLKQNNWKGIKPGFRDHDVSFKDTPNFLVIPRLIEGMFPVSMSDSDSLLLWYTKIQQIHPLSDLNGRVFGIIVSILYHNYILNQSKHG